MDHKPKEDSTNNFAEKLVHYCEENYSQIQSIEKVADYFGISYQILRKKSLSSLSKTPLQIINEIRVRRMKQLLTCSDISCRLIGTEVGFDGESTTCRFFLKHVGVTMSDYRKSAKENSESNPHPTLPTSKPKADIVFFTTYSSSLQKKGLSKKPSTDMCMVTAQPIVRNFGG